ncbi:hypothetical protein [Streptomyces sp. NPDC051014]|uniref:hypothetical protein n=1 Tax=Streptomyces sp. NPDC051014 TaxID=3155751 RepID=UPI0033DA7D5E
MIVTIKAEWQQSSGAVRCELVFEDSQGELVAFPAQLVIDEDDVTTPQLLAAGALKLSAHASDLAGIKVFSAPE